MHGGLYLMDMTGTPLIDKQINPDTILFFDMDGTLVDTDFANFLSYKEAINFVLQTDKEIQFSLNERFNRTTIKKIAPNLTEEELENIVQQKEINYKEMLHQTKLNKSVADILIRYYKTNKTVLVTNCRKERALLTLNYHNLSDKFSHLIFRQYAENGNRVNKYENAINHLNLSAQNIIVFENEKSEIDDAVFAGILIDNIVNL